MRHDTVTRWHGQRLVTQRIPVPRGRRTAHDEPKLRWHGNTLELDVPFRLTRRVHRASLIADVARAAFETFAFTLVCLAWVFVAVVLGGWS